MMTEMIFISAPHGHSRGSTSKIFRNKRAHEALRSLLNSDASPLAR
jgi:hypothetical protein